MNFFSINKRQNLTQSLLLSCFFLLALCSAIAPHLIGVVCYLLCLICFILTISEIRLNQFSLSLIGIYIFLIILSFIFSNNYHVDNSAFNNVIKLVILTTPILLVFSTKNLFTLLNSSWATFYLPALFFIIIIFCSFQINFNFALKNYISGKDLSVSYVELNNVIVACSVLFWFISAILIAKSSYNKYSVPLTVLFFMLLCLSATKSESAAAALGLAISTIFFCIVCFCRNISRLIVRAFLLLSVLSIFFIPKLIYQLSPDHEFIQTLDQKIGISSLHRVDIWERSIKKIIERPVAGWGNSDSKYLNLIDETFKYDPNIKRPDFAYPHNIFLQITLELGVLGLVALIILLNIVITGIYSLHPAIRPFAIASFICALCVWMVGYPLWRSWWLVFLSLLSGGFYILSNSLEEKSTV